jgi:hypothetical protein
MPQQLCQNCGKSFEGESDDKCPHCEESVGPSCEIWQRYFLISFFDVPALAPISMLALMGGEVLTLIAGAGASAYLLARSEGKTLHSADIVGYWMLFVVLYAIIGGAVLAAH